MNDTNSKAKKWSSGQAAQCYIFSGRERERERESRLGFFLRGWLASGARPLFFSTTFSIYNEMLASIAS